MVAKFYEYQQKASLYSIMPITQFKGMLYHTNQGFFMVAKFYEYQQKASIYYAYHTIQR
jgi:hypothetical protein